ncbi:MAG: T9SS type A sorting domain-containing protein, partial [Candidatus Marinimicrobia bacterium]|nr:T9SS type A sorting domain-containing protein [Candidatus Neomarinimicrobiota bacterium]
DNGAGLAPALIIERGARIIADGTPDAPITFTSNLPEDQLPQRGTWGGLILLGNAPTNKGESFVEGLVGVPYGGNDPHDDSGILRYVRVWYGGRSIGQDNEINGITFAGVGDGTVVEYCEVAFNLDDGFEFFGGTVNVRNLSVLFVGDDAFDSDEGYQGKGQFLFAIQGQDVCGRGFEMDNSGSNMDIQPRSYPQFHNVTLIGPGGGTPSNDGSDQMIRLREGTGGDFRNVVIAYGNGVGVRVSDDATLALIGDSLLFNESNIIFSCTEGQFHSSNSSMVAINADPMFMQLDGRESGTGIIDPRPIFGSPVYSNYVSLPDDGFFTQVDYSGAFNNDMWLADWSLLSETGRLSDQTGIANGLNTMVSKFSISSYPNPFNPIANIKLYIAKNDNFEICVYNMLGQKIVEMYSGYLNQGYHVLPLDGSKLASGSYMVQLSTGEMTYNHQITLLK